MLHRTRNWADGAELILSNGMLILRCDYNDELRKRLLDEIPTPLRRWDPTKDAWMIAPSEKQTVRRLVRECLNENVIVQEE